MVTAAILHRRCAVPSTGGGRSVRSAVMSDPEVNPSPSRMPNWVWKAVAVFWLGYLLAIRVDLFVGKLYTLLLLLLVSLFLSLAVEPGVNRLAKRGWRRGTATIVILLGVMGAFIVFVVAIGALVGQQIADLLGDSETYVNRFVNFANHNFGTHIDPTQVLDEIQRPDGAEIG